jgi:predicted nucleotidyltransferase
MIELSPVQLSLARQLIGQHIPHQTVVVFGSRVSSTVKPYSDLDLCIMNNTPLPPLHLISLKEAFSNSDLPFRTDILEWAKLSDEFKTIIQKNNKKIYPAE